jgi:hypothetical protein
MDIHPPHAPIRSIGDFLLQLVTITAGIVIALSFEGVREWRHDRNLVREAQETIAREIADNKKEIDTELAGFGDRRKKLETAYRFANDLLTARKTDIHQVDVGSSLADLSAASWQTAERTGALAHMDYGEVQKYSKVYGIQQLFVDQQRRSLEHISVALTLFAGSDPTAAPPRDLETFRQQVMLLRGDLVIEEQLGQRLAEVYGAALSH